jgi:hypothetical protein
MKPIDLLGNELVAGDVVVIKPDHVVAVVTAVETGDIVRGLSIAGPKPEGQQIQPHIVLRVEMSSMQGIMPNGLVPGVIKVQKPEQKG